MRVNPIDTQASREGPETRCAARTYEGVSLGTVKVRYEQDCVKMVVTSGGAMESCADAAGDVEPFDRRSA